MVFFPFYRHGIRGKFSTFTSTIRPSKAKKKQKTLYFQHENNSESFPTQIRRYFVPATAFTHWKKNLNFHLANIAAFPHPLSRCQSCLQKFPQVMNFRPKATICFQMFFRKFDLGSGIKTVLEQQRAIKQLYAMQQDSRK